MRRLITFIFFSFVFVAFLSFSVSAQTSCINQDDTIMRISAVTNAHGEIFNAGGYPVLICYSTIFGGPTPPNPHACTGNNKVVGLFANTNSHAQIPSTSGYGGSVCYGDLVCQGVPGDTPCTAPAREVVSLSGDTNAHIENASANVYGSSTNYKICCSNTPVVSSGISNANWSYYDGTPILKDKIICPKTYAIMNVTAMNIPSGDVEFKLWDDDSLSDDLIATYSVPVGGNQANVTLNLSDPSIIFNLTKAMSGESKLDLFFKATYLSQTLTSHEVGYDGKACSPSKPIVSMLAPVHKGVYFIDTNINFVSSCSSKSGPMEYEWTITPQNGVPFTEIKPLFPHKFVNAGQVNVKLKCTDILGQYAMAESQMLLVDNTNKKTLAYINQPAFESIVYHTPPLSGPYFPQNVTFNASDSFVIETTQSATCPTVSCLGGGCRPNTENSPAGCGTGGNGGPIPIETGAKGNYMSLFFNWTFWDSDWNEQWSSNEGTNGVKNGIVYYDDLSDSINDKHMNVNVTYATGASANFKRDFTLGRCLNNGNTFYSDSGMLLTNVENNACMGGDVKAGTADDCCPLGAQCMLRTGAPGYNCQIPLNPIIKCEDFKTPEACNSNNNTAIPRNSYGKNPAACEFLECYWTTTSAGANTCGVRARQYQKSASGCNVGSGCVENDCIWTTTQSECTNGMKTITYSGSSGGSTCGGGSPSCTRAPVTVPCGSLSFELSFFGKVQFVIAIFIIAVLYFAFGIYRGRKNEKK